MVVLWIVTLIWAIVATVMVVRNPFPFPDRGHRLFGVADRSAMEVVLKILARNNLPLRFKFRTGPTVQALMSDGYTVIHLV